MGWADMESLLGAVLKMLLYKLRQSGNIYIFSNAIASAFPNAQHICFAFPCQRRQCNIIHLIQASAVSTHTTILMDDNSAECFTTIQA